MESIVPTFDRVEAVHLGGALETFFNVCFGEAASQQKRARPKAGMGRSSLMLWRAARFCKGRFLRQADIHQLRNEGLQSACLVV